MRISVIIPTLNEQAVIHETLTRTAALGVDEIVVVDGGSTDETKTIVEAFLTARRRAGADIGCFMTAPPGRAQQLNAGAAASQGETLLFLHADTHLPDGTVEIVRGALSDQGCVGGRFDVRFEPDAGWGWLISRMMNGRSRLSGIATGDQAIFVRRTIFQRLGGFADIPIMEDVDFTRRLKREGRLAALRPTVLTSYRRWARRGPLRTILLMWLLRLLYWVGISPHILSRMYADVR